MATTLKTVSPYYVSANPKEPVDATTLSIAQEIIDRVRAAGQDAVRELSQRFGDIDADEPMIWNRYELQKELEQIPKKDRQLLERTAKRIDAFAKAQTKSLSQFEIPIPGGMAGQSVSPVKRAGCYAPGGRFPLPSSVLMTAVTAKAAGVKEIWVASPKPAPITLAAAAVAGADYLLAVGGAQAIAALAYGAGEIPACDVIVGPGNKFVTAAKKIVSGQVGIDMLAGPSELLVLADSSANPAIIAADLLAQAEHDPDAVPVLVTWEPSVIDAVNNELESQLQDLVTADTAKQALDNGFAVLAQSMDIAIETCNRIGPEHLEIQVTNAYEISKKCDNWGGLFIGENAAEVLGDYGAGPNHTLPTGGTARYTGGLSVHDFLRVRTWIQIDEPQNAKTLAEDSKALANLEGLAGHARAASKRL